MTDNEDEIKVYAGLWKKFAYMIPVIILLVFFLWDIIAGDVWDDIFFLLPLIFYTVYAVYVVFIQTVLITQNGIIINKKIYSFSQIDSIEGTRRKEVIIKADGHIVAVLDRGFQNLDKLCIISYGNKVKVDRFLLNP